MVRGNAFKNQAINFSWRGNLMKNIFMIALLFMGFIKSEVFADQHQHGHGDEHEHSEEHQAEDQTTIEHEIAKNSGIKTDQATARDISAVLKIQGKILPSEHRIAHVIPRFSGLVREGRKHIGDSVAKGEVLAIIESNQSLQPFEVKSQIAGTVINGHLIVGEFVPENQWIYIVADLSEVWADFYISLRDRRNVKIGQNVIFSDNSSAKISYIAPYVDEKSQTQLVRVIIPNEKSEFLPGMFVMADLVHSEAKVKVAVKSQAIQTYKNQKVVFVKNKENYQARPISLGLSDNNWTEVLTGLEVDEEYVTENSFLIKADILKSEAGHEH